ncbi:MAG: trypsin-like peptidase domain-containing protein [Planctomycetaceae bacterium]
MRVWLSISRNVSVFWLVLLSCTASALERWDRAVCLVQESADAQGKKSMDLGTAFIVETDGELVLATAAHVAKFTTAKSKLLFRNSDGESRWVLVGALNGTSGSPWRTHENSDLAVMRLCFDKLEPEIVSGLTALAVPLDALSLSTPPRTTKVELTGFPINLGLTPALSPLVMCASVASRETECEGNWGTELVWLANPVVGDGVSGGPVFHAAEEPTDVRIVGMYIGYMFDKSGPKLARVVPSRLIREMIEEPLGTE